MNQPSRADTGRCPRCQRPGSIVATVRLFNQCNRCLVEQRITQKPVRFTKDG